MEKKKYKNRSLRHWVSVPIIGVQVIPLIILDIFTEFYHRICFPLYGLDFVSRNKYIKIDRYKLKYLTFREKIGCAYCGYANGLLPYASRIAAETEKYWCGIKHSKSKKFQEPKHHKKFMNYGDNKAYDLLKSKK